MKRFLEILVVLILASVQLRAMEKLQGYCERGGQTVTTGSSTSTTKVQRSYPSCTVTVYNAGTLTISTIYSDNGITPKANPFTADTTGYWYFYAANGNYDVKLSGGGISSPFTMGDLQLQDLGTGGITSLNSQTGATQTFASGTSGTDFAISSAANVHTFNLPTASATKRGALSAADWTTFNSKESALTFNAPLSRAANAVSLTTPLTIAQGGTNATTQTGAFDGLAPTTAKGDLIAYNGTSNIRVGVGTDGYCLVADAASGAGMKWGQCLSTIPVTVANGGTGAATLTGVVVGAGTSTMTGVAATSQLQALRRKPNQTSTTYEFAMPGIVNQSDFNFAAQAPGGTLTGGVGASATLTPCPLGVNGADTDHYLYISGGTGTAERITITGGTCTSGLSTGTVTFTPANDHSGAWTISSYSSGGQEAASWAGAGVHVLAKFVVPYTSPEFTVNNTTAVVKLFRLPANGEIRHITVKHSEVVGDGAGAMSAVSVSVGSSGSATTYTTATQVGEDTPVADTTFQSGPPAATRYTFAADTVLATFTATGANFGNGTATNLTTGSVTFWIDWVVLN